MNLPRKLLAVEDCLARRRRAATRRRDARPLEDEIEKRRQEQTTRKLTATEYSAA